MQLVTVTELFSAVFLLLRRKASQGHRLGNNAVVPHVLWLEPRRRMVASYTNPVEDSAPSCHLILTSGCLRWMLNSSAYKED